MNHNKDRDKSGWKFLQSTSRFNVQLCYKNEDENQDKTAFQHYTKHKANNAQEALTGQKPKNPR